MPTSPELVQAARDVLARAALPDDVTQAFATLSRAAGEALEIADMPEGVGDAFACLSRAAADALDDYEKLKAEADGLRTQLSRATEERDNAVELSRTAAPAAPPALTPDMAGLMAESRTDRVRRLEGERKLPKFAADRLCNYIAKAGAPNLVALSRSDAFGGASPIDEMIEMAKVVFEGVAPREGEKSAAQAGGDYRMSRQDPAGGPPPGEHQAPPPSIDDVNRARQQIGLPAVAALRGPTA